ncbi:HlyD family secretion protein [Gilliamella sp. B14448G11]|uniref:HlyD family secretion protein n=1 Tax=unclassified Gilliamella TaxID=2685620 RepID=UPI0018DECA48|nr:MULTISPECIES: HlyD family secretion protein [unclassified Gilliamella]MBI0027130.1 HlyD family secretion protein [Gilliamella sp. B14448G7]MBI0029854.1 HlyD family secretion protein [Gilliamella sp. B14384G15]MBI0034229.1 HlyD family secretion protein [Gilliamella sp. B14448G11]MBI0041964.1 HlyD family secretion protein [Gilliamella sp. B14448G12]MBI0057633.1 HlyD family secretion protein [Gilliamella sp. B14384G12]
MENNGLFRQEAINYQKAKWMGKALLIKGYSAWFVFLLSIVFIIVLVLAAIFGTYTRRINVPGEITTQPRAINLFSTQQGFIINSHVKVGDKVKKGDPIYDLDVSQTTQLGNVTQNTIESINNQINNIYEIIETLKENKLITSNALKQQIDEYNRFHQDSLLLVKNAEKGMSEMFESMQNYADYQKKGLINNEQFNNQRYLYYQQQNSYQFLQNQIIQENLSIIQLNSELVTKIADFDNKISEYQFQLNALQRQLTEVNAKGTLIISAPSDGRIESLSVTDGQMVKTDDSLAQLIPANADSYYLVLWAPNESVPYISVNDKINIRYEAYPYQKFGQFSGEIMSISNVPASSQEMSTYSSSPLSQNNINYQAYYKVMVSLDKQQMVKFNSKIKLTNGMKADITLFLEKRPIYQWMLSPFYDIQKSITGPINE